MKNPLDPGSTGDSFNCPHGRRILRRNYLACFDIRDDRFKPVLEYGYRSCLASAFGTDTLLALSWLGSQT